MHNDSAQLKPQRGKDPVLADSGETLDINNNQQDCYSVPALSILLHLKKHSTISGHFGVVLVLEKNSGREIT